MTKRERDAKPSKKASDNTGKDSLKAAHLRDESAQTRDIERMSDKTPDEAESNMAQGERDAQRMRTKNEI